MFRIVSVWRWFFSAGMPTADCQRQRMESGIIWRPLKFVCYTRVFSFKGALMIARFTVRLPYDFVVQLTPPLTPCAFVYEGYEVTLQPPEGSEERYGVPVSATINGEAAAVGNLLRVDFHKDEFDRQRHTEADPPVNILYEVVNTILARLRSFAKSPLLKPLEVGRLEWDLQYLTDAGEELPGDPRFVRARHARVARIQFTAIESTAWQHLSDWLPSQEQLAWDVLLLDAEALLPEVGPSIVLAQTALEVLIVRVLDHLALGTALPEGFWEWISDRDDFRKEPSLNEKFDALLKFLSGHSLKEKARLWEGFTQLKDARNSFVHRGAPRINEREEVTPERAADLIRVAGDIVQWLEEFLPENSRTVRMKAEILTQVEVPIFAVPGPSSDVPPGAPSDQAPSGHVPSQAEDGSGS